MALYHQLKFPSTFIEYRSVSEWKGVVVISNFDSLEGAPSNLPPLGRCLVCLGLNSPLVSFTPRERTAVYTEKGLGGPQRDRYDVLDERNISCLYRHSNYRPSGP